MGRRNREDSILNCKSYKFAIRIVNLSTYLQKLSIALKEANETDYWLSLMKDTDLLESNAYKSLEKDCDELIALLVASIKTAKKNN